MVLLNRPRWSAWRATFSIVLSACGEEEMGGGGAAVPLGRVWKPALRFVGLASRTGPLMHR